MKFIAVDSALVSLAEWRLRGAPLRSACAVSLLLVVVTLTAGCPLIIPMPGDVRADHSRSAPAGLRGDEGIVVITAGKVHGSELNEKVISCVRDALATTQPAPRVIGPDTSVRLAFGELRDGKGLGDDAALQEYVASLKLHYAVFVTPERGETPRRWETMGGGGVAIATDHEEWYALSGLVMDLSSGLPIGSVRAQTEAKSGTIFVVPLLIVWMSQWTRDGKVCVEFGREVARLLRDEKSASPQDESRRSRMPTPDPGAVPRPGDLPPETTP